MSVTGRLRMTAPCGPTKACWTSSRMRSSASRWLRLW